MIDLSPGGIGHPVSIPSEHGLLHGQLAVLTTAPGIVVLAHAAKALDGRDERMAAVFRHAGFSTLTVDLLARQEEHFPDVHNNVPLLARRLIDFLGLLKNQMLLGALPEQPIGLCAAGITSPVVVRVASLRDHEVAAIVCRGGLIDLAGVLYLHSLESPLLMLVEETDAHQIASSHRALQEVTSHTELKLIPEIGFDAAVSKGYEMATAEATQWFVNYIANVTR